MNAKICLLLVCAALCNPVLLAQSGNRSRGFACRAVLFQLESFEKEPNSVSPDQEKRVQLTKSYKFVVWNRGRKLATLEYRDLNCCIEVGWSPDSAQFFVMYSNSGGYASFSVHWYSISGGVVLENQATKLVSEEFAGRFSCPARGPNNLFFLGWGKDSSRAFLVAEVEAAGDCGDQAGHAEGFLVEHGTILRRFTEKQTEQIEKNCRTLGILGPDLAK